jgi:hypothetical protein
MPSRGFRQSSHRSRPAAAAGREGAVPRHLRFTFESGHRAEPGWRRLWAQKQTSLQIEAVQWTGDDQAWAAICALHADSELVAFREEDGSVSIETIGGRVRRSLVIGSSRVPPRTSLSVRAMSSRQTTSRRECCRGTGGPSIGRARHNRPPRGSGPHARRSRSERRV